MGNFHGFPMLKAIYLRQTQTKTCCDHARLSLTPEIQQYLKTKHHPHHYSNTHIENPPGLTRVKKPDPYRREKDSLKKEENKSWLNPRGLQKQFII